MSEAAPQGLRRTARPSAGGLAIRAGRPHSHSIPHRGPGGKPRGRRQPRRDPKHSGANHPTRTHHAAPRSPRVCAGAAGKPTRAVQSGLRVTKSRARLEPARTHAPARTRTDRLASQLSLKVPFRARDEDSDRAATPNQPTRPGWARRASRGRRPRVSGPGPASLVRPRWRQAPCKGDLAGRGRRSWKSGGGVLLRAAPAGRDARSAFPGGDRP